MQVQKKNFFSHWWGPFLVGAPVRPHMSPMSKCGTGQIRKFGGCRPQIGRGDARGCKNIPGLTITYLHLTVASVNKEKVNLQRGE